ncbi:putative UDP-galactose transporter [Aspergillus melleus]|uniref:putative UDP-galactose transporter n=1 Tax=Aspergillus melleus TaxID=138277 RepID=UPI001E8D7274|nr:UDP-galactose transporter Gms1 [Aspergillus melleus]KAH8435303.1 UDP-galactose transporter Gms1 [Aspergillus melleus]
MGGTAKQPASGPGAMLRQSSWILLTAQYTAFVLLLHYSRVMPPTNGKRYIASTAVFFNEVIKLAISLTIALYEVSKSAPPTVPATSLLSSLTAAVFSGDSWKLAIPAGLYTLSNSLQYVALSNLQAATFQVTYQLKLVVTAVCGLILFKRTVPLRKWGLLLLLLVGIALVQMPDGTSEEAALEDKTTHPAFPRSLEEWKAVKLDRPNLHKRSATYEGIEEDILTAFPRMNGTIGLLAAVGACIASGLASIYFEKVIKDSAKTTSVWVRNVQLAVYSVFPALFIGVIFLDGETIAANGFFEGYNWAVWSTILVQAVGGITSSFYLGSSYRDTKNVATATSIALSTLGSIWLFEFEPTGNFLLGTFAVLVATYLCEDSSLGLGQATRQTSRPPPIRIDSYEKDSRSDEVSPVSSPPNEISIKLPGTPFLSDAGLSTSRPTSPGHPRLNSARTASGGGGYFDKH